MTKPDWKGLEGELRRRNITAIEAWFSKFDASEDSKREFLKQLLLSRAFVTERIVEDWTQKRDGLIEIVERQVHELGDSEFTANVKSRFELLKVFDDGLHEASREVSRLEATAGTPAELAGAFLSLADSQYRAALIDFDSKMAGRQIYHALMEPERDSGAVSMDDAIQRVLRATSILLKHYSMKNGWSFEGFVVLPEETVPAVNLFRPAASIQNVVIAQEEWRNLRIRLAEIGGSLIESPLEGSQPEASSSSSREIRYETEDLVEPAHFISHLRFDHWVRMLSDQFSWQGGQELVFQAPDIPVKPGMPLCVFSREERLDLLILSDIFQEDARCNCRYYAKLQLVEWVRGFCCLRSFFTSRDTDNQIIVRTTQKKLVERLQKFNLMSRRAKIFLDAVSLKTPEKSSIGIGAAPIVRLGKDDLLIFGPSLFYAPSALKVLEHDAAASDRDGSEKGRAFEKSFWKEMESLKGRFPSEDIHVYRLVEQGREGMGDGRPYEYDTILEWGNYIFVFECKNHILGYFGPSQSRYFLETIERDAKQVRRLADLLIERKDVVSQKLRPEAVEKTVVACVVNNLPITPPHQPFGVLFADFRSLLDFFEGEELSASAKVVDENGRLLSSHSPIRRRWRGSLPTPEELLATLQEDAQARLYWKFLDEAEIRFKMGPRFEFATRIFFSWRGMSLDEMVEGIGGEPSAMRAVIDGLALCSKRRE